jgi:ribosomal protein S18 acetylase RimI-like enzyme
MPPDPQFRRLGRDEWKVLRDARLIALRESPCSFLAKHDQEEKYGQERWQTEFDRGDWFVGELEDRHVFLTGVTREAGAPKGECYLEYVWVAPDLRRRGTALCELSDIIGKLEKDGVRTVFLWTLLKDNEAAQSLYERLLFITITKLQKLDCDPRGRLWVRLKRNLI